MFETVFFPWLVAQSSLSALIGTRLYPGFAPDAVTKPYVVWHLVTAESEHSHQGPAFRQQRIQFSVFAETFTVAGQVRDALLVLLDGKRLDIVGLAEVTSFLESVVHIYEATSRLHALHCDFTITTAA